MSESRSTLNLVALYGGATLWNACLGMIVVLIPLYANSLGFSIIKISSLIALPVVGDVVIRFLGGALSDRFGEARVLQACYVITALAAALLIDAQSYAQLLTAQFVINLSRTVFWTPIQSIVSQLPGSSMGKKLGRLSASNYGGAMLGLNLGGFLAAFAGYRNAFIVLTAIAIGCVVLSFALPPVEPKPQGRSVWQLTRGVARFLAYRQVWLIVSVSYGAALPVTLTVSIYPLYLAQLQYGEQWIGTALSMRALGPVFIGLILSHFISREHQVGIFALAVGALGIAMVGSGFTGELLFLMVFIAVLGAAGGVMDVLYQVQASLLSRATDRSVAMAACGLGWNLSPFFTSLLAGGLAELYGFRVALIVPGLLLLVLAAAARQWHHLFLGEGPLTLERLEGTSRVEVQREIG